MNCFLCKGNMIDSTTSYITTCNGCNIVLDNVPCLKCEQCGEEFITGSTMLDIESEHYPVLPQ